MKKLYGFMGALAPLIPAGIKEAIRSRVPLKQYDYSRQQQANPLQAMESESYPQSRYRFAIMKDVFQDHQYFVAACVRLPFTHSRA